MNQCKEDECTNFILTRYLYVFDEVGLSFVESLLTHKSLEESLFWISELYHSGFSQKSWELLWFVYLDFYFVTYPGFIKYLSQKHKTFTFTALLAVVHNLHAFKRTTPFVFLLRILSCNLSTMKDPIQASVYKGRKPAWLVEHFQHASMHNFIRDLFTRRYEAMVCHSLPCLDTWSQDTDHATMQFISSIQTFYQVESVVMESLTDLLHSSLSVEQEQEQEQEQQQQQQQERNEHDIDMVEEMTYRQYVNYKHVLLAIVCLFEFSLSSPGKTEEENISDNFPIKEDDDYNQFLDKEYKAPKTSKTSWSPKYIQKTYTEHSYITWTPDTFMKKVIYLGIPNTTIEQFEINQPIPPSNGKFPSFATSESIIPFQLSREAYNYDIIDLWRENWIYFASKSPLWYSRLSSYDFVISHEQHVVDILSDEDIESFHSAFPYDPEQTDYDIIDNVIPRLYQEYQLIDWLNIIIPNQKLGEHCYGHSSRYAVYLKYHIHALLHHEHVHF